jgi:hypothetical protein
VSYFEVVPRRAILFMSAAELRLPVPVIVTEGELGSASPRKTRSPRKPEEKAFFNSKQRSSVSGVQSYVEPGTKKEPSTRSTPSWVSSSELLSKFRRTLASPKRPFKSLAEYASRSQGSLKVSHILAERLFLVSSMAHDSSSDLCTAGTSRFVPLSPACAAD